MANHIFSNENWNEFFAVMYRKTAPMKSGLIVERRDQVLIIFFELGPSARTFCSGGHQ